MEEIRLYRYNPYIIFELTTLDIGIETDVKQLDRVHINFWEQHQYYNRELGIDKELELPLEGSVLNKHETVLLVSKLLAQGIVTEAVIKAMDLGVIGEFDNKNEIHPSEMLSNHLLNAIEISKKNGTKISIILDSFIQQFNKDIPWPLRPVPPVKIKQFDSLRPRLDSILFHLSNFHGVSVEVITHNYSEYNLLGILNAIRNLDIHGLGDHLPHFPLNVFRGHDHSKGIFLELKNGNNIFLLPTFNFNPSNDIDTCIVFTGDKALLMKDVLLSDATNQRIELENMIVLRDGSKSLNTRDIYSSEIMVQVRNILLDSRTKQIDWSSQFLPDVRDLEILEWNIRQGKLDRVRILSPDSSMWSPFYKITGGLASLRYARRMAQMYPDKFELVFTKSRKLHAKFILVNNGQSLLIGSHNFNSVLGKSRTSEIAVLLSNPDSHTIDGINSVIGEVYQAAN